MSKVLADGPLQARAGAQGSVLAVAVLVITLLLTTGAGGQNPPSAPVSPPQVRAAQQLPFEGSWSTTGTRQVLAMGPGKRAIIFHISGSMILAAQEGLSRGFLTEVLGYGNEKGIVASCVWTDDHGDQIFSEIEGPGLDAGSRVVGVITGGTGRFAGITGTYEFDWRFVVDAPEGVIQGWVAGLKGSIYPRASAAGKASP